MRWLCPGKFFLLESAILLCNNPETLSQKTFGRRVIMIMQVFIFATGSVLCGTAVNMDIFIVGRGE